MNRKWQCDLILQHCGQAHDWRHNLLYRLHGDVVQTLILDAVIVIVGLFLLWLIWSTIKFLVWRLSDLRSRKPVPRRLRDRQAATPGTPEYRCTFDGQPLKIQVIAIGGAAVAAHYCPKCGATVITLGEFDKILIWMQEVRDAWDSFTDEPATAGTPPISSD